MNCTVLKIRPPGSKSLLLRQFSLKFKAYMNPNPTKALVNTSQLKEGRRTGALAVKVGMLTVWDKWGEQHAVTVLHLDNVKVLQVKTDETDGHNAVQLCIGEAKLKRVKPTIKGHYARYGIMPGRKIAEFRVTPDQLLETGTTISARHFVPGQLVDVCGISKCKGFQGVMKKWNFAGGNASHGNSLNHRTPGSTGQRQDPGKVFKGKKMPGRMGAEKKTLQNLKVLKVDPNRNLLYIIGGVPGFNGGFVRVTDAVKGPYYPTPAPMPTYFASATGEPMTEDMWAPVSEKDKFDLKEPEEQN